MGKGEKGLSAVDYVIFIGSLLGALGIGVWSAYKSKQSAKHLAKTASAEAEDLLRTKGTNVYQQYSKPYFNNEKHIYINQLIHPFFLELSMGPVVLSLVASFLSAIFIVGL